MGNDLNKELILGGNALDMWEILYDKWLCVRNGLNKQKMAQKCLCMWEITLICVKCLKYVRNKVHMFEIAQIYRKQLIYVGNGLDMWETAEKFWKRLKYVGNDLDMWEMAQTCDKGL